MHFTKFILFLYFAFIFETVPVYSKLLKTYANKSACALSVWSGYYPVAPIAKYKNVTTMEQCLNICDDLPDCLAINYVKMDKLCYFLNRYIKDTRDLILKKIGKSFKYLHVLNGCNPSKVQAQKVTCGLPASGHNPTIGQPSGRHRILGGTKAHPHSYPFIVLLEIEKFGDIFQCHGALIPASASSCGDRSDLIITAAHCTIAFSLNDEVIDGNITVKLGKHKLFEIDEYQMTTKVSKIIRHPNYNNYDLYDYAILKLANTIPYSDYIRPVCLPEKDAEPENPNTCITAGWGLTDKNRLSPFLLQLMQPVLNDSVCESFDDNYNSTSMLCAGDLDSSKNVCPGDSGSPLVCFENGTFVAYGLLSFINNKHLECDRSGIPAYYSRISSIIDWIDETREMFD